MRQRLSLIVLIWPIITSCSPNTRQVKFYLLQPVNIPAAQEASTEPAKPLYVGVGPVTVPAYLDRPQIVTGGLGSELQLAEYHRWAEPLKDSITRVMAENLTASLPGSHVLSFPWNRAVAPDIQVEVKVSRFHVDALGNCELKADWAILSHGKLVSINETLNRTSATSAEYEAKVAAQSQALAKLGKAIAMDLQSSENR